MTEPVRPIPFSPVPQFGFSGHAMPSSVPEGLRLELSRAPIVPGKEAEFDEWMQMLNDRYDENLPALPAERAVFEASFQHTDSDGSTWIYHLSLIGEEGGALDETLAIGADHAAYSRRVKQPGWEELIPKFMLTPAPIRDMMTQWGRTGTITPTDAPSGVAHHHQSRS